MAESNIISLSIVIPTLDAAARLSICLESLMEWRGPKEVIVVDGGSEDATVEIARTYNITILHTTPSRGEQMRYGATYATGSWLLFLHADTVLEAGWADEVRAFIENVSNLQRAAAFKFVLDDNSTQAHRVERLVAWRCHHFGLPYGDQGLCICKNHYTAIGGYRPIPLMEDIDLIQRLGKNKVQILDAAAVTSAERYQRDGWWARPSRNLVCLFLYMCGLPPHWITRFYR
ncbi:MAG: TIGR04283 family arsenosugar biosynthesis glycosyltransferase [Rhodospirillaceae bacterium]